MSKITEIGLTLVRPLYNYEEIQELLKNNKKALETLQLLRREINKRNIKKILGYYYDEYAECIGVYATIPYNKTYDQIIAIIIYY